MDGLTLKQKAFADNYIISGNATDAAKKAGYSEKTAYSQGNRLLKNVEVLAYIQQRTAPIEQKRIASGDEVLQFFTRVMNGEEKDAFGLEISVSDRIAAGKEILKRKVDDTKLENEKERLQLERMRVQSQIKEDSGEKLDKILQNMDTLYERLKPVPDRNIEDFE